MSSSRSGQVLCRQCMKASTLTQRCLSPWPSHPSAAVFVPSHSAVCPRLRVGARSSNLARSTLPHIRAYSSTSKPPSNSSLSASSGLSSSSSSERAAEPTPRPPKRPSPYRLLQPHAFLSDFAPLHISGWRLDTLPSSSWNQDRYKDQGQGKEEDDSPGVDVYENSGGVEEGGGAGGRAGDLQDRRLVRAFQMGEGKEGWRDTIGFVRKVGEIVEEEDHHPTISISPSSDYSPSSSTLDMIRQAEESRGQGYIVEISTHTHTPLPPYPTPTPTPTAPTGTKDKTGKSHSDSTKIRPGITRKDIKLAEWLESAWKEVMRGRERVEVKAE
ncbi:uncharacterized protein I303_105193 [Kwoniella dejecticola CBS 10117]|uniref:Uncharacterized protein n=1 Tax=Kwoniella dejecticola CBS 10117 TaxID=1296121 RepID=A0A1A6A366_9TREE|nr:uncharacterized protein I303_05360 [Kwoniella dejecticola CBS 10117]OBR84502.1 hypothetical protein I303_05360 [Kwoniella dejecticola CBS 10117]